MPFTKLPQDMLQYEINRHLDPLSRAEFNGVLKPDERIYSKFPANYALKHAILTSHKAYHAIVSELNYNLEYVGGGIVDARGLSFEKKCVKCLRRLFAFFKNPLNSLIFLHRYDLKKKCISAFTMMTGRDFPLYTHIDPFSVADLVEEATLVLNDLQAVVETGKNMTLADHKSIY
jgi:hypothetical protein